MCSRPKQRDLNKINEFTHSHLILVQIFIDLKKNFQRTTAYFSDEGSLYYLEINEIFIIFTKNDLSYGLKISKTGVQFFNFLINFIETLAYTKNIRINK